MLSIVRNTTKVEITIASGLSIERPNFLFTWDAQSEWAAELLALRLRDQLGKAVERARRESYEQGWKDAKAKKGAKLTWFSGVI